MRDVDSLLGRHLGDRPPLIRREALVPVPADPDDVPVWAVTALTLLGAAIVFLLGAELGLLVGP